MSALDLILLSLTGLTLFMFVFGGWRATTVLATLIYGALVYVLAAAALGYPLPNLPVTAADNAFKSSFTLGLFGETLTWNMTGLGWFFALITLGAAFFSSWYMTGAWGMRQVNLRVQNGLLALNVLAMVLLLSSGDLLSLFIGWELVSWASYAMMVQSGGAARAAAYRYLLYALSGAMAILAAIILIRIDAGSFAYAQAHSAIAAMSPGMLWLLFALFVGGFGVKMALVPMHLWQADAYSQTPGASSAFLNAISSRMGLFAIIVSLVQLIGLEKLSGLDLGVSWLDARFILMWVAAISMVVPTFIALMQTDALKLLTWHGIGQGGYMLLGVLTATSLGTAGGLMHVLNHATYQAALILSVTAVVYRTGTSDLDELGGLITRMPLSYITLLMGIIGLAGLPPMNGFVSKWMVYKSLLEEQHPLLLLAAFVGTLGTILSVYKLIHNIFLGQLRREHLEVREAPASMVAPMLILGLLCFVTGAMPGLTLGLVDVAQGAMGVALQPHHLGGVTLANGSLNMLWVVGILVGAIGVGALIFWLLGGRRYQVHQFDNYAGGHFLSADIRYHFSHEFYPGLARVIGPWYRGSVVRTEQGIVTLTRIAGDATRGLYRLSYTPVYALIALVVGLLWVVLGGAK